MNTPNSFGRGSFQYTANDAGATSTLGTQGNGLPYDLSEVRRRRVMGFLADFIAISVLCAIGVIIISIFGILTFSLGWLLFPVVGPATALIYAGATLGGPSQATPGMRMFDIKLVRTDGRPVDFWMGVLYAAIFWFTFFTLLVLLVSLFTPRKELLQDLLMGTFVVRK